MSLVYTWDPRSQCTYVYEQESHYDPQKKASRPKRKYLGRLDPETGTYAKVGRRGRRPKDFTPTPEQDTQTVEQNRMSVLLQENQELKKEVNRLKRQQQTLRKNLMSMINCLDEPERKGSSSQNDSKSKKEQ